MPAEPDLHARRTEACQPSKLVVPRSLRLVSSSGVIVNVLLRSSSTPGLHHEGYT